MLYIKRWHYKLCLIYQFKTPKKIRKFKNEIQNLNVSLEKINFEKILDNQSTGQLVKHSI